MQLEKVLGYIESDTQGGSHGPCRLGSSLHRDMFGVDGDFLLALLHVPILHQLDSIQNPRMSCAIRIEPKPLQFWPDKE